MLKKLLQSAVVAGVLAMMPVATASAACQNFGSFNYCFTFTFSNNSFTVSYDPGGTSTGILTAVGIGGYTSITGGSVNASGGASWSIDPNLSSCAGLGNIATFQLCAGADNGITNGLNTGGSVTLSFTGNATESSFAWLHLQQVNGTQCSLKLSNTGGIIGGTDQNCGATTVTPEPASLLLVGTGLIGIGGLVRRRRRLT